jgi:dihydroxy-acid dehydratase
MLGYLKDGDRLRIDLLKRQADVILTPEQIAKRKEELGPYKYPPHQTPWQEIYRNQVSELSEGMVLKDAVKYQRVAKRYPVGRANH